uniref:Uncharacterized protein n=1 Tax=Triticum urartu TaxID=4572 RepID=A0A8R7TH61_TRIUA
MDAAIEPRPPQARHRPSPFPARSGRPGPRCPLAGISPALHV